MYGIDEKSKIAETIVPQSFTVYFFKLVKTLFSKKNMRKYKKGQELDKYKVLKHFKILPTTFMVAGNPSTHN